MEDEKKKKEEEQKIKSRIRGNDLILGMVYFPYGYYITKLVRLDYQQSLGI